MTLLRFTLRTHRTAVLGWTLVLGLLAAVTGRSYQSSYPTTSARHLAAALARTNAATTALYGRLALPGTATQMFTWEMGTFLTVLAAIMGVLLALAATRVPEDAGMTEVLRAAGVAPAAPLRAALTLLGSTAALLTAVTTAAIGLGTAGTEGASWPGALTLGATIGVTFLLTGTLTCVVAQILPTAAAGRTAAFTLVGISFLVRAAADAEKLRWPDALTPLGLRALTEPFAGDHPTALIVALVVCAALAAVALALDSRRDLGAGLVPAPAASARRLDVHTPLRLQGRLVRASTLAWTAAVTVGTGVFTSLGSTPVTASRDGTLRGGFLGSQLGTADPADGFLRYDGTIVGIVVGIYVVLTVLRLSDDERSGRLAHVLVTGVRRTGPLTAAMAASALGCLLILVLTATTATLIAPRILTGDRVAGQAFVQMIGQWPALLTLAGLTGLACGAGPRWRHLAWIPLAFSAFVALLGTLLKLPRHLIDLGVFQHVPTWGSTGAPWSLGLLLLVAVVVAGLGLRRFAVRDLATG